MKPEKIARLIVAAEQAGYERGVDANKSWRESYGVHQAQIVELEEIIKQKQAISKQIITECKDANSLLTVANERAHKAEAALIQMSDCSEMFGHIKVLKSQHDEDARRITELEAENDGLQAENTDLRNDLQLASETYALTSRELAEAIERRELGWDTLKKERLKWNEEHNARRTAEDRAEKAEAENVRLRDYMAAPRDVLQQEYSRWEKIADGLRAEIAQLKENPGITLSRAIRAEDLNKRLQANLDNLADEIELGRRVNAMPDRTLFTSPCPPNPWFLTIHKNGCTYTTHSKTALECLRAAGVGDDGEGAEQ